MSDNPDEIYPQSKPRSETTLSRTGTTLSRVGNATLRFFGVMEPTDMSVHTTFYATTSNAANEDDVPTYDVEAGAEGKTGRSLSIRSVVNTITRSNSRSSSMRRTPSVNRGNSRPNSGTNQDYDPDIPLSPPPTNTGLVTPSQVTVLSAIPPGRISMSSNNSDSPSSARALLPPRPLSTSSNSNSTQGISFAPERIGTPGGINNNNPNPRRPTAPPVHDDDSDFEFYSDEEEDNDPSRRRNIPLEDAPPQYDQSQELEMERVRRDTEMAHRLHQQDIALSEMDQVERQLHLQRQRQLHQQQQQRNHPQRLRRSPSEPGSGDIDDDDGQRQRQRQRQGGGGGNRNRKGKKKEEELPPALKDPKVREQLQNMTLYRPWFLIICSIIQVVMMFYSMYFSYSKGLGWIQLRPFNYMIGPGTAVLVQLGAKYNPCILDSTYTPNPGECPSEYETSNPPVYFNLEDGRKVICGDLETFCGLGGFGSSGEANQWYRFITAIFLHGGVLHLLMNLLVQVRAGFDIERSAGFIRIFLVYMSSGIFGFVLAALFAPETPTVGASGSIYGLVALLLVDLVQNWKLIVNPWRKFLFLLVSIFFSLAIGVIPYLDNWAHIGGFLMGLVSGVIFMPSINFGKWDARRKKILVLIAIPIYLFMMGGCFWMLYSGVNASKCQFCTYFDCIPAIPGC